MRFALTVTRFAFLIALLAMASPAQEIAEIRQWGEALKAGDMAALRSLYSTNPPARYLGSDKNPVDIAEEFQFWQGIKDSGARDLDVAVSSRADQQGLQLVSLAVSFRVQIPAGMRTRYVLERQYWHKQGDTWRIVLASHSKISKMPQPKDLNSNLYPPNADAKAEIKELGVLGDLGGKGLLPRPEQ